MFMPRHHTSPRLFALAYPVGPPRRCPDDISLYNGGTEVTAVVLSGNEGWTLLVGKLTGANLVWYMLDNGSEFPTVMSADCSTMSWTTNGATWKKTSAVPQTVHVVAMNHLDVGYNVRAACVGSAVPRVWVLRCRVCGLRGATCVGLGVSCVWASGCHVCGPRGCRVCGLRGFA
jgi:hypothetical protein